MPSLPERIEAAEGKETPKQYCARHLRVRIERAKSAVMEVQEYINDPDFRLRPNGFQELADAALSRLDTAWRDAKRAERAKEQPNEG